MKFMSKLRRTARISFDLLIFVAVCFIEYAIHEWFKPYKRGFFCNDDSLNYPYRDSTLSTATVVGIVLLVPNLIILVVELFRQLNNETDQRSCSNNTVDSTKKSWHMRYRLKRCYGQIGYYLFGLGLTVITMDIAKYCLGRLRPHFFAVCQPQLPDGSTCEDAINRDRYISEYECLNGGNFTDSILNDLGQSFPSGHANVFFYGMLYISIYLQAMLSTRASKLLKHLLQFIFMMCAWYIALTRITDYWHHWSDVLAGALLGSCYAALVAVFVANLFQQNKVLVKVKGTNVKNLTQHQVKPVNVVVSPASGSATLPSAAVKTGTSVLPAYTFGTIPYLHHPHAHPHAQYGHTYQNYGYVP